EGTGGGAAVGAAAKDGCAVPDRHREKGEKASAPSQRGSQAGIEPGEVVVAMQDVEPQPLRGARQPAAKPDQPRGSRLDDAHSRLGGQLRQQAQVVGEAYYCVFDPAFRRAYQVQHPRGNAAGAKAIDDVANAELGPDLPRHHAAAPLTSSRLTAAWCSAEALRAARSKQTGRQMNHQNSSR